MKLRRILVRAISYTVHGLIPASCVFADRYNREEVVRSLGKEVNINPPLMLGQLPDTPEELLKLDQQPVSEGGVPITGERGNPSARGFSSSTNHGNGLMTSWMWNYLPGDMSMKLLAREDLTRRLCHSYDMI
ncbi:unnamed protein product [Plutella xylostella]|uniref:(diamondback moth) hypothetical protein n=1 Tax=Plutella xylostella TaxID=51655 RepID=A0A8S4DNP2_PLUXY|nr:unnamed protein product [Plutella xylostella]